MMMKKGCLFLPAGALAVLFGIGEGAAAWLMSRQDAVGVDSERAMRLFHAGEKVQAVSAWLLAAAIACGVAAAVALSVIQIYARPAGQRTKSGASKQPIVHHGKRRKR